jgi:hypothetical protein
MLMIPQLKVTCNNFGILLKPAAGVILMSMSTIIVDFNSRTLKIDKIHETQIITEKCHNSIRMIKWLFQN